MASAVKQNLKIVAYVHKSFHNLLFPKIEALNPYATIVNAGYDIENYNENYLKIFSRNVLNMIRKGESGWEKSLPPKVAQKIKKGKLFGFKPSK